MMNLQVITYDHPHRKTQDLLYRIALAGFQPGVMAIPWIDRKNFRSLYATKPNALPYRPGEICARLGFDFSVTAPVTDDFMPVRDSVVIIAAAGILPGNFVSSNIVVNSHCGWLPEVRGLDALKWAIYDGHPVGVTTHVVDAEVDRGRMIERREVPLYPHDDLFSIACRQFELEIDMLVEAIKRQGWEKTTDLPAVDGPAHRRMGHSKEQVMIQRLKTRLAALESK